MKTRENMMIGLGLLGLIACDSDKSLTIQNPAPIAEIVSHLDGDEIPEGSIITLIGSVTDTNDPAEELVVMWYLGEDVVCGPFAPFANGDTLCELRLTPEDTDIRLEVKDPENARGEDSLHLIVVETEQPAAEIISPVSGGVYYSDQLIAFEGILSDAEDDENLLEATWESSIDGLLTGVDTSPDENGEIIGYTMLSEGQHAIELAVSDTMGKTSREAVIIQVGPPNANPECSILAPITGAAGVQGETVLFSGLVSDVDVAADWLSVTWRSDKDGDIGTSTPTSMGEVFFSFSELSVNTHTITMLVEDEVGATCSTALTYTVGTPPNITIISPSDGAIYSEGEPLYFSAIVSDSQDQPTAISLDWALNGTTVSSQAAISSGEAQYLDNSLPRGTYSLVVTATDTDGLTNADQLSFVINGVPSAPGISISPNPADTLASLTANIDTPSIDPEGVSPIYSYEWQLNNVVQPLYITDSIPSSATEKHDEWKVRVTASDGLVTSVAGEALITIQNTAPMLSGMSITPAGVTYNDDVLTCSVSVIDPDETLTPFYSWTLNGVNVGSSASLDLALVEAMPNDILICSVAVTDSNNEMASDTRSVTVSNRAPNLSNVQISPSSGVHSSTSLTCSSSFVDDDGEALTPSYSWTIGTVSYAGATLQLNPSIVSPADTVSCTVALTDDYGGTVSDTVAVVVDNSLPEVVSVQLDSAPFYTNDTITATAALSDLDNPPAGSLTASYEWHVIDFSQGNIDRLISSVTSNSLFGGAPADHFGKGDQVYVIVTPHDGTQAGIGLTSSAITISNSAPSSPSISVTGSLSNAAIVGTDDLICSVTSPSVDDDPEDTITYIYNWTHPDGYLFGGGGTSTSSLTDIVHVADVVEGSWVCQVTPNDGDVDGGTVSNAIVVDSGCYSMMFEGGGQDYIETNFASVFSDFTAEVWVKISDYSTENMRILDQDEAFEDFWLLGIKPAGTPFVYLRDSTASIMALETTNDIVDGFWHHLAYVRSGADNYLYIDGELAAQDSYASFPFQPAAPLYIGSTAYSGSPPQFFNGELNAVRLSNAPLYLQAFSPEPRFENDSSTLLNLRFTPTQIVETSGNGYSFVNQGAISIDTCPEEDGDGDGVVALEDCDDQDPLASEYGSGASVNCPADSCASLLGNGYSELGDDGVYWLDPDGLGAFEAYCDMTYEGGGWTLLAKFSGSGADWSWNANNWNHAFTFNEIEVLNDSSDIDARGMGWSRLLASELRLTEIGSNSSIGAYVVFPNPSPTVAELITGGSQLITPTEGDITGFTLLQSGFQGNAGQASNVVAINYNHQHTSSYIDCNLMNRVRIGSLAYAAFSDYPNGAVNTGYVGIGGTTVFRDGHENYSTGIPWCSPYPMQSEIYSNTSGDSFVLWGR